MANGFAVSALVGKREMMERGGLHHAGERVFLLSTTHGAETHSLAAALETMAIYRTEDVVETLWDVGAKLRDGIQAAAADVGVGQSFEVVGQPPNLVYATRDPSGRPSQAYRTLFLQEMMDRGVIAPSFVVSAAHGTPEIERTVQAARAALEVYAAALEHGSERFLRGRSVQPSTGASTDRRRRDGDRRPDAAKCRPARGGCLHHRCRPSGHLSDARARSLGGGSACSRAAAGSRTRRRKS